jgi:hypothetical protein
MIRYLPLAFTAILASCTATQQRDAALGVIVAGAAGTAACALTRPQHATGKQTIGHGACVVGAVTVTMAGGVVLHSLDESLGSATLTP